MFLVNWLASSSLMHRLTWFPSPEPAQGSTQALDKTLTREEDLSVQDKQKMAKIKSLWCGVASELGMADSDQVKFAVQDGEAETSVAVWHEGSPTIVLPFSYLQKTVVLDEEQARSQDFDNREWAIWSQFVDRCPDHVPDMFTYTEQFTSQFSAKRLRKLANRYGKYLTQIEFEAELAHEFGHIQARHLNPMHGRRLGAMLRSFASVALPWLTVAATTLLAFAIRDFTGTLDLVLPLVCGLGAGACVRSFLSDHVLRESVSYVRRQWEKEADAIAASSQRLCQGNVRLYKRDILLSIVQGGNIDGVVRGIFEDAEHHPSDGSRLRFFLGRLKQHHLPTKQSAVVES